MAKSILFKHLCAANLTLDQQLDNYYAGGMEDICLLDPANVLVFFHHQDIDYTSSGVLCHQRYQLKISIGNESSWKIDKLDFRLKPDTGILIFPYQMHTLESVGETVHHMTISFTDRSGSGQNSILSLKNRLFQIYEEDLPLLEKVAGVFQKNQKPLEGEAIACLKIFLTRKLQQVQIGQYSPNSDLLLEALLAHIREMHYQQIKIKELAYKLNLSESHLRKRIREITGGLSLGTFLRRLRFNHANELLTHTELSLKEIAKTCGYSDAFSFSRAFKHISGITPVEFRIKFSQK